MGDWNTNPVRQSSLVDTLFLVCKTPHPRTTVVLCVPSSIEINIVVFITDSLTIWLFLFCDFILLFRSGKLVLKCKMVSENSCR